MAHRMSNFLGMMFGHPMVVAFLFQRITTLKGNGGFSRPFF
jgi:hypothetical protein